MRCSLKIVVTMFLGMGIALPAWSEEESLPQQPKDAQVEHIEGSDVTGKWERDVRTNTGQYRFVKEHRGQMTRLTITDATGRIVQEKTSRYEINTSGKVRIFTYFDNNIITGQNQGAFDAEEKSYLYRIEGDTFYEIHGLQIGEKSPVVMVTWRRVRN